MIGWGIHSQVTGDGPLGIGHSGVGFGIPAADPRKMCSQPLTANRYHLKYDHRIPITEETIFFANGFGVDFFQPGQARRIARCEERGHEAE